ncbi:14-3-3 protein 7 isoform X5 [Elaeis guineensis]|uniref:14-3-3 protein 7 isoform X5 n=1 Tax=Elaeis guineensis var. tenera TaxID=51953 RepID=UPI003C6D739D
MEEMEERERHVYMAKLAEKAERYEGDTTICCLLPAYKRSLICHVPEMVESLKKIARMDIELTAEERNLLSVGYKNVIGPRRASWRILAALEEKEEGKESEKNVKRMQDYKKRVEDELTKICNDILSIIAIHLLPSSTAGESIVYFYKIYGCTSLPFTIPPCCARHTTMPHITRQWTIKPAAIPVNVVVSCCHFSCHCQGHSRHSGESRKPLSASTVPRARHIC